MAAKWLWGNRQSEPSPCCTFLRHHEALRRAEQLGSHDHRSAAVRAPPAAARFRQPPPMEGYSQMDTAHVSLTPCVVSQFAAVKSELIVSFLLPMDVLCIIGIFSEGFNLHELREWVLLFRCDLALVRMDRPGPAVWQFFFTNLKASVTWNQHLPRVSLLIYIESLCASQHQWQGKFQNKQKVQNHQDGKDGLLCFFLFSFLFFFLFPRQEGCSPWYSYIFSNTGKSVAGTDDKRQPTPAVIQPAASRT